MTSVKIGLMDTTMGFHRRDPLPDHRQHAEEFLKTFGLLGTSSFAHLEFKRSYITDLAYLHRILRKYGNVNHAVAHVSKALGTDYRSSRRLCRVMDHVARFVRFEDGEQSEVKFGLMLDMIENAIESDYEWFVEVDFVHDGTGCVRSKEPPRVEDGKVDVTVSKCKPEKIKCRAHLFFEEKKKYFTAIRDAIGRLDPDKKTAELANFVSIISQVEANPRKLCDDSVCRKLGDALIAVDCTDGNPSPGLISSNFREYSVLCEGIDVCFFRYDCPKL